MHKFDVSLARQPLRLAKSEHKENDCPGESSEENRQLRSSQFVMSQEQIKRFKSWRTVSPPELASKDGKIETLSGRSWRRVREAIFPVTGGNMLQTSSLGFLATRNASNWRLETRHKLLLGNIDYESMERDKQERQPSSVPSGRLIQAKSMIAGQRIINWSPHPDAITTFVGALNVSADDLDYLKTELPEKLFNELRLIDPAFSSVARLSDNVPSLLRSFALRLGSIGSSKTEMELMLFLFENRESVYSSTLSGFALRLTFA